MAETSPPEDDDAADLAEAADFEPDFEPRVDDFAGLYLQ